MGFIYEDNRIYLVDENDKVIAEVTFPSLSDNTVNINRTFVDDSLRGQGIAGKLMEALAAKLRSEDKKAVISCSYAIKWFENHPEFSDLQK